MMRTKVIPTAPSPKVQESPTKSMASSQTLVGDSPSSAQPNKKSPPKAVKPDHSFLKSVTAENSNMTISEPVSARAQPAMAENINATPSSSQSASSQPTKSKNTVPGFSQSTPSSSQPISNKKTTASIPQPAPIIPSVAKPKRKVSKKPSLSKPQTLVTFIVDKGANEQTFVVHEDFATFHSSVFAAAFKSGNRHLESKSNIMRLPDIKADIFGKLVHWIYTREVEGNDDDEPESKMGIERLCNLWKLAGDFKMMGLQNAIMPEIIDYVKQAEVEHMMLVISIVYEVGNENTPFKKLVVDKITWGMEPEQVAKLKDEISEDFLGLSPSISGMWADVALTFSKHYWDDIPGKYFRELGVLKDYLVVKDEDKNAAVLE